MDQQQQQPNSNSFNFVWTIVLIVAVALLIWWLFGTLLLQGLLYFKFFEAKLLNLSSFGFFEQSQSSNLILLDYLRSNPEAANSDNVFRILHGIGNFLKYPAIIIISCMAAYLYFFHTTLRYNQIHSMKSLREQEAAEWPHIRPILHTDLCKTDLDEGGWAMAKNPIEFAKKNRLLTAHSANELIKVKRGFASSTINEKKALQIFQAQLGPTLQDFQQEPTHVKIIFAALAAKANHDGKEAANILRKASLTIQENGMPQFDNVPLQEKIDHAVRKYKKKPFIKQLQKQHAYRLTFLASLLQLARRDGVQNTADFLWLKLVDRPLWYMLNNVGRRVAFCEVAGPYAHWLVEKKLQRPLKRPYIDEAVVALKESIETTLYTDKKQKHLIVDEN